MTKKEYEKEIQELRGNATKYYNFICDLYRDMNCLTGRFISYYKPYDLKEVTETFNDLEKKYYTMSEELKKYKIAEFNTRKVEALSKFFVKVSSFLNPNDYKEYNDIIDIIEWRSDYKKLILDTKETVELHNDNVVSNFDELNLREFVKHN